ncbi:MAG: EF-Tu/IF-2/RF-3 family GTPase, partial [Pseudomonadota bacterium]
LGRILTGRIYSGTVKTNQAIKVLSREGAFLENGRVNKILAFRGLERVPIDMAEAGDIVAIAGIEKATVADTICAPEMLEPLPSRPIDPSTLVMTFSANDSPLVGREGTKLTSRIIGERLHLETESNVAIKVSNAPNNEGFLVAGRGELQLGVFIETLRREGFELSISRPRVVTQTAADGSTEEPIEEIMVDVDDDFVGVVVESLSGRKCEMQDMRPSGGGKTRITFHGPARGLIGYHGQFLTETRGTGIMNRSFHSYGPHRGPIPGRRNGVLISNGSGKTSAYAMWNLQDRGKMFITPDTDTYQGMIIGEHNRDNDLEVNPLRAKQLSNVRASGKDEAIVVTPPVILTLEQAVAYIESDELVEVTPKSIRLRKRHLDPNDRKRAKSSDK